MNVKNIAIWVPDVSTPGTGGRGQWVWSVTVEELNEVLAKQDLYIVTASQFKKAAEPAAIDEEKVELNLDIAEKETRDIIHAAVYRTKHGSSVTATERDLNALRVIVNAMLVVMTPEQRAAILKEIAL